MATKKDLQQAQSYSRRRVLTAFVSGMPGGKELEPANPMRTVIAAVAIAILLVLGSLVFGLIKPGLPNGWQNDKLLLSGDTGARYVSKQGVLHPVLNTTSARLVIPAKDFDVVTVDENRIADVPRGATIGILGAPDELPTSARLIQTGWSSCVATATTVATTVSTKAVTAPLDGGMLVTADGEDYLVDEGTAYPIPAGHRDAVVRVLGLAGETPVDVPATWLALFPAGTELAPASVAGDGDSADGGLRVGDVVHQSGTDADELLVVTEDGQLAALSPFASALYSLTHAAKPLERAPSELSPFGNAREPFGAQDWPSALPTPVSTPYPCAVLDTRGTSPAVALAEPGTGLTPNAGVHLDASSGAVVRGIATGDANAGQVAVVDASGTAYPVPEGVTDPDTLARLGFTTQQVVEVPATWLALFPSGPSLTKAGAASAPDVDEDHSSDTATDGDAVVSADADMTSGLAGTGTSDSGAGRAGSGTGGLVGPVAVASAGPAATADAGAECTAENAALAPDRPVALDTLQSTLVAPLATGKGVTVAVVDSGVDASNPHLSAVVLPGLDLVDPKKDGREDEYGHGTAIAGLIAAQRIPGSGVVGLAPDARILPVRVFRGADDDDIKAGNGPRVDRIAAGIRWATDHGADVINVSLSTTDNVKALRDAVAYATAHQALVVASAGNTSTADPGAGDGVRYPAGYEQVLGVAAADTAGAVEASFTGPQVGVISPGQDILTSAANALDCTYSPTGASTSFATGYASAAAALVAQEFPKASAATWKYRLEQTASRPSPDRRDDVRGWGLIQPYEALTAVLDGTSPGPVNPDAKAVVSTPAAIAPVSTAHVVSPLEPAQESARWIAVVAAALLALLALVARVRKGRADAAAAAQTDGRRAVSGRR